MLKETPRESHLACSAGTIKYIHTATDNCIYVCKGVYYVL